MPGASDLARPWLNGETVLFGMPDTIMEPRDCFTSLLEYHRAEEAVLSLGLFPTDNPKKFGMVGTDSDGNVTIKDVDITVPIDLIKEVT